MKPHFTIGSGQPPAYVSHVIRKDKGHGCIKVVKGQDIKFSSEDELWEHMKDLAKKKIPFSVGGMSLGADEELGYLMDARNESLTYLRIAWRNQNEWTIHEIISGAKEWDQVTLNEILS